MIRNIEEEIRAMVFIITRFLYNFFHFFFSNRHFYRNFATKLLPIIYILVLYIISISIKKYRL